MEQVIDSFESLEVLLGNPSVRSVELNVRECKKLGETHKEFLSLLNGEVPLVYVYGKEVRLRAEPEALQDDACEADEFELMSVKQLKAWLLERGYADGFFKGKKKADLIAECRLFNSQEISDEDDIVEDAASGEAYVSDVEAGDDVHLEEAPEKE